MSSPALELEPAEQLEREAARSLAEALGPLAPGPDGDPESRRSRLQRTIDLAERALRASAEGERLGRTMARVRLTLVRAHAARAEDARHGAGQFALSAQRAPTIDACESGWQRAGAIAGEAAEAASRAAVIAAELAVEAPGTAPARTAGAAAGRAEKAAREARTLLEERNLAFTFHVDADFSFGEGWHVAAAAVLAGVAVQVEPGKPATPHAEHFLRDAGVAGQLATYRSRPRAMKQTTEIVARAFLPDPAAAMGKLRAAFLGDAPIPAPVVAFAERRLVGRAEPEQQKVGLWIRNGVHQPGRNTGADELPALMRCATRAGLIPVLIGEALPEGADLEGAVDMTLHRMDPVFRSTDARRAQLQLFEYLRRVHGLVGQLGVTTAGMDGPALMGLPTAYLTEKPNARLRQWVGAVPGYEEILRDRVYLDQISSLLGRWAGSERGGS